MKYVIVKDEIENLESKVDELIEKGYQPVGGPFFIGKETYGSQDEWGHWYDDSECIYGQALVFDSSCDNEKISEVAKYFGISPAMAWFKEWFESNSSLALPPISYSEISSGVLQMNFAWYECEIHLSVDTKKRNALWRSVNRKTSEKEERGIDLNDSKSSEWLVNMIVQYVRIG